MDERLPLPLCIMVIAAASVLVWAAALCPLWWLL